jgi:hypothetical protein
VADKWEVEEAVMDTEDRFGSPVSSMRTPSRASLAMSASTVFGDGVGSSQGEGGTGRTSPGSVLLQEGPAGWGGSPFRPGGRLLTPVGLYKFVHPVAYDVHDP